MRAKPLAKVSWPCVLSGLRLVAAHLHTFFWGAQESQLLHAKHQAARLAVAANKCGHWDDIPNLFFLVLLLLLLMMTSLCRQSYPRGMLQPLAHACVVCTLRVLQCYHGSRCVAATGGKRQSRSCWATERLVLLLPEYWLCICCCACTVTRSKRGDSRSGWERAVGQSCLCVLSCP